MSFPSVARATSYIAKQSGYEFGCYDLHGGDKCFFRKIPPSFEEIDRANEEYERKLAGAECHEDSDCLATQKGGCVSKSSIFAKTIALGGNAECTCLSGPVTFGCVPKGSNLIP